MQEKYSESLEKIFDIISQIFLYFFRVMWGPRRRGRHLDAALAPSWAGRALREERFALGSFLLLDCEEVFLTGFREEAVPTCIESTALMNNIKAAVSSVIHETRM